MHLSRGGDQRILIGMIRPREHPAGMKAKDTTIDRQNGECLLNLVRPLLDLLSFLSVALTQLFNASLNFAERQGAYMQSSVRDSFEPR